MVLKEDVALVFVLTQPQHHMSHSGMNLVPDVGATHCHKHCSFY